MKTVLVLRWGTVESLLSVIGRSVFVSFVDFVGSASFVDSRGSFRRDEMLAGSENFVQESVELE